MFDYMRSRQDRPKPTGKSSPPPGTGVPVLDFRGPTLAVNLGLPSRHQYAFSIKKPSSLTYLPMYSVSQTATTAQWSSRPDHDLARTMNRPRSTDTQLTDYLRNLIPSNPKVRVKLPDFFPKPTVGQVL